MDHIQNDIQIDNANISVNDSSSNRNTSASSSNNVSEIERFIDHNFSNINQNTPTVQEFNILTPKLKVTTANNFDSNVSKNPNENYASQNNINDYFIDEIKFLRAELVNKQNTIDSLLNLINGHRKTSFIDKNLCENRNEI